MRQIDSEPCGEIEKIEIDGDDAASGKVDNNQQIPKDMQPVVRLQIKWNDAKGSQSMSSTSESTTTAASRKEEEEAAPRYEDLSNLVSLNFLHQF